MLNFDTCVREQSGYKKQSRLFTVWGFLFPSGVAVAGLTVSRIYNCEGNKKKTHGRRGPGDPEVAQLVSIPCSQPRNNSHDLQLIGIYPRISGLLR